MLGLISHEYFHTWNIKRLRPAEFAQFDYGRENYTGLLWFFEGFTSYYDDLLVRRAATSRFGQAAYGRVYGFVYSGLDSGLALAPLVFGGLMDGGRFAAVLIGIAALQGLAILTALRVGGATRQVAA